MAFNPEYSSTMELVVPPYEIERRFLVYELPSDLESFSSCEITQAYLPSGNGITQRIRMVTTMEDGIAQVQYLMTIKGGGQKRVRPEIEWEIPATIYYEIYNSMVDNAVLKKRRYFIPLNDQFIAHFDQYHNELKGNYIVEVEFKSFEQSNDFEVPSWFGKEVTGKNRYGNASLARNGWPTKKK